MYVKDANGKYRLVDRDQKEVTEFATKNVAKLSLEEIAARLKRLEQIVIDPRK
jgi:hypothetical protein